MMPKGPFRTKNTTTIARVLNYYAVVFLLRPPNLVRRGPFFERKNVCNSQENGVCTRCAAIVNHPAVLKILRVVNLLRVVFLVRRGPLGRVLWGEGLSEEGCDGSHSKQDSGRDSHQMPPDMGLAPSAAWRALPLLPCALPPPRQPRPPIPEHCKKSQGGGGRGRGGGTGRPNGITDREKIFSNYLCIS